VKNQLYKFKNGFAFKVPVSVAQDRYKLKPKSDQISPGATGNNLVWISPDGKHVLSNRKALENNNRRRAARTLSDSWADFKAADPEGAKKIGWNGFQKGMRGIKGSRIEALRRFKTQFDADFETYAALEVAADGDTGERNGWGDSG
jgi:hypothetical protein